MQHALTVHYLSLRGKVSEEKVASIFIAPEVWGGGLSVYFAQLRVRHSPKEEPRCPHSRLFSFSP